jgi:hypothetical protein
MDIRHRSSSSPGFPPRVDRRYNPARRPAFIKAPRLSDSMPYYWFSRVAATTGPRPLSSPSFRYPSRATGWTTPLTEAYAVLPIPIPSGACQSRLEMSPRGTSFLLCALPALLRKVKAACVLNCVLTRGICCACLCPALGEPIGRSRCVSCPM